MPIPVSCQCGKSFQAPDELAGKTVKCPACGMALQIPGGATLTPIQPTQPQGGVSDLLSEAGVGATGPTCPACSSPVQENAVICIQCGYNLQTGQKMRTMTASGHAVGASDAEKMLARAEVELEKDPVRHDEGYGSMQGAWLTLGIMAMGLIVSAGLLYAAFRWVDAGGNARATAVMYVLGYSMSVIGHWWVVVIAFRESVVQGILCIFVPCYSLLYIIVNFGDCTVPGILALVGFLMCVVAGVMSGLSGDETTLLELPARLGLC